MRPASIRPPHRHRTQYGLAERAVASGYTSRWLSLDLDRQRRESGRLPLFAAQAQNPHIAALAVVKVPAHQRALLHEAETFERGERADVLRMCVGADPLQPETAETERQHQRLGLGVRPTAPVRAAKPGADDGAAVARRELR